MIAVLLLAVCFVSFALGVLYGRHTVQTDRVRNRRLRC